MLQISNLTVTTKDESKVILKNITLHFETGKIHAISGQNGSGKSTLAQVIIGNPEYILSKESVLSFIPVTATTVLPQSKNYVAEGLYLDAQTPVTATPTLPPNILTINLTTLTPDQRSHLGIFVSMQYPTEVPGVNLLSYLKLIVVLNRKAQNLVKLTSKQTLDLIHSKIKIIGWSAEVLKRNLNEGMSGGERKKSEILQMLLLDPKLIILDEIDSGLDKEALELTVDIIKKFLSKDKTIIVITHQQKILDLLQPDQLIYFKNGSVV
jgi:Fe-S cluster assembly ATP-binding protein